MNFVKGKHAVLEALQSGANIDSIIVSESILTHGEVPKILQLARQNGVRVIRYPVAKFKSVISDANSQNIVAKMTSITYCPITKIIENMSNYPLVVLFDHIEDPFNFGAILRTCVGLGVKAAIFPKDRNVSINAGVIKASSGAVFNIDLIMQANMAQAIIQLKKAGYWIYGTDVNSGMALSQFNPATPAVLIIGNENKGMSKRLSSLTHENIHIPLTGPLESLNVSVATGIILYHFTQHS